MMLKRPLDLNDKDRLSLQMMLDNAPDLKAAYELKEEFADIYELPKAEALEAFKAWPAKVPEHLRPAFKEILTAMKNWETEILAFFDYPITNGYTEAVNGVAKVINRAGRGYSFEVLRARLLFKERKGMPVETVVKLSTDVDLQYRRNPRVRAELLAQSDGRCMSCQGLFQPQELFVHSLTPVVPGEHFKNGVLVCDACHRRFHTDSAKHHDSDSTR